MSKELVILYQEMSDLTAPECANVCRVPHSCCSPEYCDFAEQTALEDNGIVVPRVNQEGLLFMGASGCTMPPQFRQMCTFHTCEINGLGFKRDDPGMKWTNKYMNLRQEIDALEMSRHPEYDLEIA